jgi:DNA transposition AAA+ family ATPase
MTTDTQTQTSDGHNAEITVQDHAHIAAIGDTPRATWSISLSSLRSNIRHMRPSAKQVMVDSFSWCIQRGITRAEFCKAVGIDASTIHRHIKGTYTGTSGERLDLSDKHEAAIRSWLQEQKAAAGQTVSLPDYVHTPTSRKVETACDLAAESNSPVFLWGPSHIGKTWALQYWAETHNHGRSPYVRCPAVGGLRGILTEIARAVGESPKKPQDKLITCLKRAITEDMVLILDEFHQLLHTFRRESFFACVETIREIHDRSRCGLVLSMSNFGRDEIAKHRRADLEQIFRRGVHRIQVGTKSGMPLAGDLTAILERFGLEFPTASERVALRHQGREIVERPREILRQLAKEEGLKAICERLRYAGKLAKGDALCWEHFTRAHVIIATNATAEEDWA